MFSAQRGNIYILCVLFGQVVVMLGVSFILHGVTPNFFNIPHSTSIFMFITQILCFVPPLLIYCAVVRPKALLSFKRISLANIALVVFMCLAIQPSMLTLSALSMIFFDNPVTEALTAFSDTPLFITLIVMAVMPSVLEEITLRGVVLRNYDKIPIKKAALANGVLFGIMHLNPQQFLYAMLLGIIFAYFMYYTESLWAPIIGHFTVNASQILLAAASSQLLESAHESSELIDAVEPSIAATIIVFGILNVIFLPLFIALFLVFIEHNNRRKRNINAKAIAKTATETIAKEEETKTEATKTETALPVQKASTRVVDGAFIAVILFYAVYMAIFG